MKLFLTIDEATGIIRDHLHLLPSIKIVIDADNRCGQGDMGWHSVPNDWSYAQFPPNELTSGNEMIRVRYRNGQLRQGIAASWTDNWNQEGSEWDIVEYQIMQ